MSILLPKTGKLKKPKRKPLSEYRKSADGMYCTMQLDGICNHNCETTVLCHVSPQGFGVMGGKSSDIHSVYACSDCHDAIDGRRKHELTAEQMTVELFRAMYQTQVIALEKGLIEVNK